MQRVEIDDATYELLSRLADADRCSLTAELALALRARREEKFFDDYQDCFVRLSKQERREEEEERKLWDEAALDGVDIAAEEHPSLQELMTGPTGGPEPPPGIPEQGEIWMVHVQRNPEDPTGRRPALVLSSGKVNRVSQLATMLPISSFLRKFPSRVRIAPGEGGLKEMGFVVCERSRPVTRRRLVERLGKVSPGTIARIKEIMMLLLDLRARGLDE